jgi:hypothetical protein
MEPSALVASTAAGISVATLGDGWDVEVGIERWALALGACSG